MALKPELIQQLRKVSILQEVPADDLLDLASAMRVREFREGEVICREGEIGRELFFLASGFVNVTKMRKSREVFVTTLGEGSYFGEASLFHDTPRIATVRAFAEVTVLEMSRDAFFKFIRAKAATGNVVLLQMLHEVFDRLRHVLTDLYDEDENGLTQEEIDTLVKKFMSSGQAAAPQ